MKKSSFNRFSFSMFWKISIAFFLILLVFSVAIFYLFTYQSEMYFQETVQKLNSNVAEHIAKHNKCFINGEVNEAVIKDVFHDVMVVNPSVEVYLLNKSGTILTYYAPDKIIKTDTVPLSDIKSFIKNKGKKYITGLDPKNLETEKPFSAAKVVEDGIHKGYIYVILNGEEYQNIAEMLDDSYFTRNSLIIISVVLVITLIVSIISLLIITGKLSKTAEVINRFKDGDINARIDFKTKGELEIIANSFNEMADSIENYIRTIENIDRSRRELIAYISHDLRTPLANILGYTDTLLLKYKELDGDEIKKYLHTIEDSTNQLISMVNELFELSKLESGQMKLDIEKFSLAELVQDIYQKNKLAAERNSITFELKELESNSFIKADIGLIERAIQNLIDNALKYTPEKGEVGLNLIANNGNIKFEIYDTGPAIDEDIMPYIFKRYYQGNKIVKHDDNSFGLGLAIVKKILDLHDSNIKVDSSKDITKFYFEIPLS